ncbi:hypothetical protein [Epibacterium ulvae]|uniref:hypothetical protein n=1 Tax=Epibacterium ulvae TaxID=1156985 RepID=UPI002490B0D0|nr:hypothetical protein [Epibacterium ulvae]
MRNIKTLSGLASPRASLRGAGSGFSTGIQHIFSDFAPGDGGSATYEAGLDLSGSGLRRGDLMIAIAYAGAFWGQDSSGAYGTTEITTPGWDLVHTEVNVGGMRVYLRVSSGDEGQIDATGLRNGGLYVSILRGAEYPSAADIAGSQFVASAVGGDRTEAIPAMADQSFASVACLFGSGAVDQPLYIGAVGSTLPSRGGAIIHKGSRSASSLLLHGPVASGALRAERSTSIGEFIVARIGLRES